MCTIRLRIDFNGRLDLSTAKRYNSPRTVVESDWDAVANDALDERFVAVLGFLRHIFAHARL